MRPQFTGFGFGPHAMGPMSFFLGVEGPMPLGIVEARIHSGPITF